MRYSPSQISTFVSCQRQWGWRYVAKLPGIPTASQSLGTETHKQLEQYMQGMPLDFTKDSGDIAASGIHLLPPVGPDITLEEQFEFTYKGHTFFGYKDMELYGEIYDHKTTSSLRWMKTEDELSKDVQAQVYAWDGFLKWPQLDVLKLTWIYYQTKGARRADSVTLMAKRADVESFMGNVVEVATWLEELYEKAPLDNEEKERYVLSLAPEPSACEKFGGCAYRGKCNLSPIERMKSIMSGESPQDIIARLRGKPAAVAVPINPPEGDNSPVPSAPQVVASAYDGLVKVIENLPPPVEPAQVVGNVVTQAAPKPVDPPVQSLPKADKKTPLVLYVGCSPSTGNPAKFEDMLAECAKRILASHNAADWRFVEFKGAGVLSATFKQLYDENPPKALVIQYPESPEAKICISWLSTKATTVVS